MNLNRNVSITWLGHAAFRLRTPGGKELLIDPWLTGNPSCPAEHKQVEKADLILVTHGHMDHLGDTVSIAQRTGAKVVAIVEICTWLNGEGIPQDRTLGMNKGGTQVVDGIKVTMVQAVHSGGIFQPGGPVYGGEPAGFVIELENGFRIYHAGDTAVFADMKIIGELYQPELAMLPIGDHFVMSPREAAYACRLLGCKLVIPMHYGTFPMLTGTPQALRQETASIEGLQILEMKPGETLK
jgi:L-ascorbate metabolism protein UlaG (beta-lactamase superfamily)